MSQAEIAKSTSQTSHHTKKSIHSKTSLSSGSRTSKTLGKSETRSKVSVTNSENLKASIVASQNVVQEDFPEETPPLEEIEEQEPLTILDLIGPPKPESLTEFHKRNLTKEDLFPTVVTLGSDDKLVNVEKEVPSILVTGFGIRNLKSLQDALDEDKKRLLELYNRERQSETDVCAKTASTISKSSSFSASRTTVAKTSSETLTEKSDVAATKFNLRYLMGLQQQEEEEGQDGQVQEQKAEEDKKESFTYSSSKSMKRAQHYLRIHRIFDFFQFIIVHLLAAAPDNPIYFILELLNNCLIYRSGAGPPPLLYETKHIAQLFCLMDRMNTGFIDMEHYVQGMKTLGICEFNKDPETSDEGISSKTFVEEVYEAEIGLFDDLIRRKYIDKKDRTCSDRPIDYTVQTQDSKTSYFMPTDLFKSLKPLSHIKEERGEHEG